MQSRGLAINQSPEQVACKLFCADRSAAAARERPRANDSYRSIVFFCSCKDSAQCHAVSVTIRGDHVISGVLGLDEALNVQQICQSVDLRRSCAVGSWESRRKQIVRASSTCREELDQKGISGPESAGKLA